MATKLHLSQEQILYFRAKRAGLTHDGANTPCVAAHRIIGGQSQVETQGCLSLSIRTLSRPNAKEMTHHLFDSRSLVRTWGQRDTVHIYDPDDWPYIVSARQLWAPGGRVGETATQEEIEKINEAIMEFSSVFTRKDLYPIVPDRLVNQLRTIAEKSKQDPIHFTAGRLIWQLSKDGYLCTVEKKGRHQGYAHRTFWFPSLRWPDILDPLEAVCHLTLRYLQSYGPATPQDIGHFFGARQKEVNIWLNILQKKGAIQDITCKGYKTLWSRKDDLDTLSLSSPTCFAEWPIRLLPLYDSMLMAHADKNWTVPIHLERKRIWRKAAYVKAVVLAKGRIIATWSYKAKRKTLHITIEPLSGWKTKTHLPHLDQEAINMTTYFSQDQYSIEIEA